MAVLRQEEDKEQQEGATGRTTTGTPAAGAATLGQTRQARRQTSGQAPNIQQYLQAGQGAGRQLAGGLRQQVEQEAEQVGRQLGRRQEQFQEQAQPLEQELGEQGQQTVQTAFKDPQEILQQQQQLEQFQRLRDQQAQQDIQQLPAQTADIQRQQADLAARQQQLGTEPGRFRMLQETFGQPGYARGEQRLDQLFLQGSPDVTRQLQEEAGQMAGQTGEQIEQFGTEAQQTQEELATLAQDRASEIEQLLQTGREEGAQAATPLEEAGLEDIEQRVQQRVEEYDPTVYEEMRQRLEQGTPTAEDLEALGLESGQRIYDIGAREGVKNLADFMQLQGDPTAAGMAEQDEFARLQALKELAGQPGTGFLAGAPEEQIGAFEPFQYGTEDLQQAIQERQQAFQGTQRELAQNLGVEEDVPRDPQEAQQFVDEQTQRDLQQTKQYILDNMAPAGSTKTRQMFPVYEQMIKEAGSPEELAKLVSNKVPSGYLSGRSQARAHGLVNRIQERQNLLDRYRSFQPTRTLEAAPEDIEDFPTIE